MLCREKIDKTDNKGISKAERVEERDRDDRGSDRV